MAYVPCGTDWWLRVRRTRNKLKSEPKLDIELLTGGKPVRFWGALVVAKPRPCTPSKSSSDRSATAVIAMGFGINIVMSF
jgi:hypothetical protein